MHRRVLIGTLIAQTFAGFAMAQGQGQGQGPGVQDLTGQGAPPTTQGGPPMLGIHWSRDFAGGLLHAAKKHPPPPPPNVNMTYHGGKILPTVISKAIFWGPSWKQKNFVGDKITGLDAWYSGHSNSNYAATVNEYTGSNGQVASYMTHLGHIIDTSAASDGSSTSTILAEVCKVITTPDNTGYGYYPVYTDVPRGNAGYCAYHSYGYCGGVPGTPVQFAFFFNLDGDLGCDPADTTTGNSQGLSALANVTAHEISEARSDPASPFAWYDANGDENGDKCAWTFNKSSVMFSDGRQWKLQGEWSNKAFTAGTGYPNSLGQNGCLDGH
jgi:hypothetical protein